MSREGSVTRHQPQRLRDSPAEEHPDGQTFPVRFRTPLVGAGIDNAQTPARLGGAVADDEMRDGLGPALVDDAEVRELGAGDEFDPDLAAPARVGVADGVGDDFAAADEEVVEHRVIGVEKVTEPLADVPYGPFDA